MRKTIFITGGAGFIGSHITEHYESECDIIIYDDLSTGKESNIPQKPNIKFIKGDIRNRSELTAAMVNADIVFHLAAEISVAASMERPVETEEINAIGTINVLEAMRTNNVKTIVYASSAAVYGENPECPKKTDMLPEPISPYAITKLSGEHYIRMYGRTSGIKGIITRFFNVFGERQDPASPYAAAVPIFIQKALSGTEITVHGDGEQTRDFIYVKDLVKYLDALSRTEGGTFNIGYGSFTTINSIVTRITGLTGSKSRVVHTPPRAGDIRYSYADVCAISNLKIQSLFGMDEGLSRTINYFKNIK